MSKKTIVDMSENFPSLDEGQSMFTREEFDHAIGFWRGSWEELHRNYSELIMAVQSKHHNETRHQTALRYISEREEMRSITEECRVKESALFRRHS